MIKKIEHIGIAVKEIDEAIRAFRDLLGIPLGRTYESEYTKAKMAFFPLGESSLELIQPTDPASVMAKFLEKRGEGIHHICVGVENIEEALRLLEARGAELIDRKPRETQDQRRIAFVNPRSTNGVLIELEEIAEGKQE
jgi:methylmalonyl-CoA/ethylmalonyl-CoA epimerase